MGLKAKKIIQNLSKYLCMSVKDNFHDNSGATISRQLNLF